MKALMQQSTIRRMAISLPILICIHVFWLPDAVAQRDPRGAFTDVGFSLSGGPMRSVGDHSATQGDFSGHLNLIHLNNFSYTGFGVEASYKGDANLELFSVMGRMEFGLGKGRPTGRRVVGFNTLYLAFMAGYTMGTVWDEPYIDLYGTTDEVAVTVSGVPLYASLGWRRIGRMGLNLEAIGGVTIITSREADLPEGTAPSLIPGFGIRVGFGFDTFFYTRESGY